MSVPGSASARVISDNSTQGPTQSASNHVEAPPSPFHENAALHNANATIVPTQQEAGNPTRAQPCTVDQVTVPNPVAQLPSHRASASCETPLLADVDNGARQEERGVSARLKNSAKRGASVFSAGYNWWWWELGGAAVGLAFVALIIGILGMFDRRSEPQWPKGIKLTGIAAISATIAKAGSLLAVTTAISQLKWLWFRQDQKPRHLADIELFDEASRGPWGSLAFFFKLRGCSMAFVGAGIVLVSLLFETFVQQSISSSVRRSFVESDITIVHRLKAYKASRFDVGDGDFRNLVRDPLGNAALIGFYSGTGKPDLKPHGVQKDQRCTTDKGLTKLRCTFELEQQGGFEIDFGYSGNGPGTHFNHSSFFGGQWRKMQWAGIWYPTASFQNFEYKISHVADNEFRIELLEASEFAIYACVKTYNVSVIQGKVREEVIATWYNDSRPQLVSGNDIYPLYLYPPNPTNNSNHSGPYYMNSEAQSSVKGFVSSKFQGYVTVDTAKNVMTDGKGDSGWIYAEGNVSRVLENVALSITDVITTTQPDREVVLGEKSVDDIYVHIRWGWLALPVLVVLSSALFLLQTIYATKSSRAKIWKSSSLVLLYHGLEEPPAHEEYPLDELTEMDRLARKHKVKLRRDDTWAWKLVASTTTRQ